MFPPLLRHSKAVNLKILLTSTGAIMYLALLKKPEDKLHPTHKSATIVLETQTTDSKGRRLLCNNCYTLAEIENTIKVLRNDLDEIHRQARKHFAEQASS